MNRLPTEEEFAGWNSMPVTDTLRQFAKAKVEYIKNSWAVGAFSNPDLAVMGLKQAEMLGALRAYAEIAELSFEDIITELGEDDGPAVEERNGT